MGGEGFNDKASRAHARAQLRYPKPDIRLALESAHGLHRRAPGLSARRTFSTAQRLFLRRVLTGLGVLTLLMPELPGLLATLIWLVARWLGWSRSLTSAAVLVVLLTNAGNFGLPVALFEPVVHVVADLPHVGAKLSVDRVRHH